MSEKTPKLGESPENKERETLESYTWGEGHPTAENYSFEWACKNDQCSEYGKPTGDREYRRDNVIGVKLAPPAMQKEDKKYAMMCECPKCFSVFWFHIFDDNAKTTKELYKRGWYTKAQPKELRNK